ncbi:N-acetyltransferase [Tateyamaria omphalii]|uniref:GNAT family N-acetyltransferase n=1 Tax=Tateyamaria omphalii TaxID=299262 RepID=UPI00167289D7|nr:GNAT family N-acetyltransferase [Tateyamaria omphalii]GGX48008.1 N-acetyltransferase [Tateyamaria omphalii]
MGRHVPTINTARVTLRAMRPGEFDRFAEIWAMPDVAIYIGGTPRTRDESWRSFLNIAGHWQVTGFGQWGIEEHSSKRLVGQVGFFHGARGLGEDFDSVPEAGWVLAPEAQGVGLGIEAAQAAHDWFDRVVTGPLVCMMDPDHAASARIAEQLGYVDMRMAEDKDGPIRLLSRKAPPQR